MKHPHAELMLEYAKDAMETDKPWELWEYQMENDTGWYGFDCNPFNQSPAWFESCSYRRKPEPEEVLPPVGTPVWVRDDIDGRWIIAMFDSVSKLALHKYRASYGDSASVFGFKYMTTENPYLVTV